MTLFQKISLFVLRVATGWMMLYAGVTKVLDPAWSSAGYLQGSKTAVWLFQFFARPDILPFTDFMNKWGLTLLGISLILGVAVRLSSWLGALLMVLYYLPVLQFPYPNPHAFIVDEHVIYALVLVFFASVGAGRAWGLDAVCGRLPLCSKFPKVHKFLS